MSKDFIPHLTQFFTNWKDIQENSEFYLEFSLEYRLDSFFQQWKKTNFVP